MLLPEPEHQPANPLGKWKDQEVTLENHIDGGWRRHLKSNSPFTSFSVTDGTTARYTADGVGITLKLQELRSAIAAGKAPGVSIVEHSELLKAIIESPNMKPFPKAKLLRNAMRDHEILVKGTIPKGLFEVVH